MATKFVEQGHVRVGPQVVKDPAFLVTRYIYMSCLNCMVEKVTITTLEPTACIVAAHFTIFAKYFSYRNG
jgi:hypothetical protein